MTQHSEKILAMAVKAKENSLKLAGLTTEKKNAILEKIAENMQKNTELILEANRKDIEEAEKLVTSGDITPAIVKRLILTEDKVKQLSVNLLEVAKLKDPVGIKQWGMKLAENLDLYRVSCPIGVIATIFESRPEVVVQISALAIKSGNAVLLKGGKEAFHSNRTLFTIIENTMKTFDLEGAVNLLESREAVTALFDMDRYIDLIIPRGSNDFVRYIQENSRIPVLGHSDGICHLYVDETFNLEQAVDIIVDSKTDYPAACNALETLLIHRKASASLLPLLLKRLKEKQVEIRGCAETAKLAKEIGQNILVATMEDWKTEYMDLILSVKIVDGIEEAIAHINHFGSHHTDTIITNDQKNSARFQGGVDSACVFLNASTRFSDGFRFGLGAEVGISTNKTHARGPVGLEGLVIYKYILQGQGQTVASFSGKNAQQYLHQPLPTETER